MKYPKNYLDEIKQRLKVSDVVGKFVSLKKRGKEFVGLSPFKNERTPSFTVNNEKGFYHCFSSGEHGNIFDFIMKTQGLDFGDTVRMLALQAGMQPYKFTRQNKEEDKRYTTYTDIYKKYTELSHLELFNHKKIIDYLTVSRKVNEDVIKEFKLGYAPMNENFSQKMLSEFSEKDLISSGIFFLNEKRGKIVDRFIDRILFPIHNLNNDIIAFGGRTINKNNYAKYINSPETEFYKKGYMLFNLSRAKQNKLDENEVVVVEGYMDVISLHDKGIKNVVSNQGTAVTESQINILWRYFENINICLDGDVSGKNASYRIAEKLIPFISDQKKIFFTNLTSNNDPDDFIKKNGKESFLEILRNKLSIEDFIWDYCISGLNFSDTYALSNFEKKIKSIYSTIQDSTLKKYINEKLLDKLKTLTPNQKFNFKNYRTKTKLTFLNDTKKIFKQKKDISRNDILEFNILFIMIFYSEIIEDKINFLQNITFVNNDNENLKKNLLELITLKTSKEDIIKDCKESNLNLVLNIEENSSIKFIFKNNKNLEEKRLLLDELIEDYAKMVKNMDIKKMEEKFTSDFDESSFNQYLELKKQINN